jgi:hypothetical protein
VKAKQKQIASKRVGKNLHRHIKLALIPHKSNQYRPHLIRRYGLLTMLAVIILAQVFYNFSTSGTVLGKETTATSQELLADTNSERAKYQLAPLALDDSLSQATYLKAQDMFKQQYWAHTAPDGTTPWHWFDTVGYKYDYAGENLAKNFRTSDAVMTAWMASPEHHANILNRHYSQAGFAVVGGILNGKAATLIVALYGSPATVAGVTTNTETTITNVGEPVGLATRFGMAVQSMTPAAIGSIALLLLGTVVAFIAHAYRNKLPKAFRQSWHRHHGLMKLGGMVSLCFVILVLYSGGQI